MQTYILITLVVIATIHLMMASVLFLYSRYKVQYLSLAWIMGIFGVLTCVSFPFMPLLKFANVGLLHPFMLLLLVVTSFLQGIYPLSIPMPGYLQWGRMWRYASPAIFLIILYVASLLLGNRPVIVHTYSELAECWWGPDMLFRLAGLGLSVYYVTNILRLPRLLVKNAEIPRYLKGYVTAMGLNMVFYIVVTAVFNAMLFRLAGLGLSVYYVTNILRLPRLLVKNAEIPRYLKGYVTAMGLNMVFYIVVTAVFNAMLLLVYFYLFCLLNMYLFYRTLETMAIHLPKPEIVEVDEAPTEEVIVQAEKEDFNETNRHRFERVEFFMQHDRGWQDNAFGRDRLCEATGINRHLLLQCLRSQGYNNCHDYINSYRISALKRGVADGSIVSVADCVVVGFGSSKTARICFERMEGMKLDDYLKKRSALNAKA